MNAHSSRRARDDLVQLLRRRAHARRASLVVAFIFGACAGSAFTCLALAAAGLFAT